MTTTEGHTFRVCAAFVGSGCQVAFGFNITLSVAGTSGMV